MASAFWGIDQLIDTDATGHPTIGYGHLCSSSACNGVGYPIPMSKDNGKKLLAKDMGVSVPNIPEGLSKHANRPHLDRLPRSASQP